MADIVPGNMSTTSMIVGTLLVVTAGSFVVAYLIYWALNKTLSKHEIVVTETKVPILGTSVRKSAAITPLNMLNGKRASFVFWIYIHDIDKYSGSRRHVMHIGDESIDSGSPVVYLGSTNNKMHICFMPNVDPNIPTDSTRLEYLTSKYGITIDYIPIQRWVHVAVVVNEGVNGGVINAYLDAELVKVATSGKPNDVVGTNNTIASIQNLNLSKPGSLVTGGSTGDEIGPGFAGLISRVSLFNYDLNVNDIYNHYLEGPIDNLFARLGLPAYGLQSPIYRIS